MASLVLSIVTYFHVSNLHVSVKGSLWMARVCIAVLLQLPVVDSYSVTVCMRFLYRKMRTRKPCSQCFLLQDAFGVLPVLSGL